MADVLSGLVDIILAAKAVADIVGPRVFEGSMARIGEADYPSVTVERRVIGSQFEAAPVGDFTILVTCWTLISDQAWRLHKAVRATIGRARWTVDGVRCTALAVSPAFPIPPDTEGQPIYKVSQIYRCRVFGE